MDPVSIGFGVASMLGVGQTNNIGRMQDTINQQKRLASAIQQYQSMMGELDNQYQNKLGLLDAAMMAEQTRRKRLMSMTTPGLSATRGMVAAAGVSGKAGMNIARNILTEGQMKALDFATTTADMSKWDAMKIGAYDDFTKTRLGLQQGMIGMVMGQGAAEDQRNFAARQADTARLAESTNNGMGLLAYGLTGKGSGTPQFGFSTPEQISNSMELLWQTIPS